MACNSKGLSPIEEEKPSETVQSGLYKERDAVKYAWTEVTRSLDFINNCDETKNLLENFTKQYLKKEIIENRTEKSGTSSAFVEKAQKDFDPDLFSTRINLYLKQREARTTITELDTESVCTTTFPSNVIGSSLPSVKAMHLRIYMVSMPVSLNSTEKCSWAQALECT